MKKFILTGVVLLICILILISSIVQAEILNPNLWWQAIGMTVITFAIGHDSWTQYQDLKKEHQK